MEKYTIHDLGFFITICSAACGGVLAVVFKSRCKTIKTPCLSCDRDVLPPPKPKDIETNEPEVEP
tara:strand:- start:166 stop:360 length:195 start_codon:yes stop_codon:yes gene_type:complete